MISIFEFGEVDRKKLLGFIGSIFDHVSSDNYISNPPSWFGYLNVATSFGTLKLSADDARFDETDPFSDFSRTILTFDVNDSKELNSGNIWHCGKNQVIQGICIARFKVERLITGEVDLAAICDMGILLEFENSSLLICKESWNSPNFIARFFKGEESPYPPDSSFEWPNTSETSNFLTFELVSIA